ncbi:MAG TPA: hypothetical protein VEV86_05875, partial [Vicinamibacterales bacterium]|nr:hypothetical protein [Vicinamibacterales bacterium]
MVTTWWSAWRFRDRPASPQSALQIECAAHTDLSVMGREPALSGAPAGIAKLHEEIPFRFALRRGLVIVEHAGSVDPVQVDVLVFV